jgi:hypothetical protein
VRVEVGGDAVRLVAEHHGGRSPEIDGVVRSPAVPHGSQAEAPLLAQGLERRHRRPPLYDGNTEDRAGGGANELRIVGIDRTGAEHDCRRTRRLGATQDRADVARIAERDTHEDESVGRDIDERHVAHRRDGEDRLRRDDRAQALEHTFLQARARDTRRLEPRAQRRERDVGIGAEVHRFEVRAAIQCGTDTTWSFDNERALRFPHTRVAQQCAQPTYRWMPRPERLELGGRDLRQRRELPGPR